MPERQRRGPEGAWNSGRVLAWFWRLLDGLILTAVAGLSLRTLLSCLPAQGWWAGLVGSLILLACLRRWGPRWPLRIAGLAIPLETVLAQGFLNLAMNQMAFSALALSCLAFSVLPGGPPLPQGRLTRWGNLLSLVVLASLLRRWVHAEVPSEGWSSIIFLLSPAQEHVLYSLDAATLILHGVFFFRLLVGWGQVGEGSFIRLALRVLVGQVVFFSAMQALFDLPPRAAGFYGFAINAPFEDKNVYGSAMGMLTVCLLSLGWRATLWDVLLGLACLAGVAVSDSRMSWLACACGLMGWSLASGRRTGRLALGVAGGLVAVGVTLSAISGKGASYTLDRALSLVRPSATAMETNTATRLLFFGRAANMILAHPLLGVGPGTAYAVSRDYQEGFPRQRFEDWAARANTGPEALGLRENLHNGYLQLAAEEGLLGLALFMALVWTALLPAVRQVRSDVPSRGLIFGLLAYGVSMLSGHPLILYGQSQLFWFVVAMAAARGMQVCAGQTLCGTGRSGRPSLDRTDVRLHDLLP